MSGHINWTAAKALPAARSVPAGKVRIRECRLSNGAAFVFDSFPVMCYNVFVGLNLSIVAAEALLMAARGQKSASGRVSARLRLGDPISPAVPHLPGAGCDLRPSFGAVFVFPLTRYCASWKEREIMQVLQKQ